MSLEEERCAARNLERGSGISWRKVCVKEEKWEVRKLERRE